MSDKEWERLQEGAIIKCYIAEEGEVHYRLVMQDNMSRWIAARLNVQNAPTKAVILSGTPKSYNRVEN